MRTIILGLSILALTISIGWVIKTGFDYEPVIVFLLGLVGILEYLYSIRHGKDNKQMTIPENNQEVNVNVNVGNSSNNNQEQEIVKSTNPLKLKANLNEDAILEIMKNKVKILFIDDDKKFSMVTILKDSGWKKTKSVIDIKGLDIPIVRESNIYFVDINGVGKLLNCPDEGLDLALMLKQKYPEKKVVIYSANRKNNVFHSAWDIVDFRLEKNALPYQFQSLVEKYSLELNSNN